MNGSLGLDVCRAAVLSKSRTRKWGEGAPQTKQTEPQRQYHIASNWIRNVDKAWVSASLKQNVYLTLGSSLLTVLHAIVVNLHPI